MRTKFVLRRKINNSFPEKSMITTNYFQIVRLDSGVLTGFLRFRKFDQKVKLTAQVQGNAHYHVSSSSLAWFILSYHAFYHDRSGATPEVVSIGQCSWKIIHYDLILIFEGIGWVSDQIFSVFLYINDMRILYTSRQFKPFDHTVLVSHGCGQKDCIWSS